MKTVHFFAFYPHNLPKNTFFAPRSSMNPKNTKSLHFDGAGWGVLLPLHFLGVQSIFFRCAFNPLQMCNQSFSNFNFRIFEFLLLLLWWFTPAFTMICCCFYDDLFLFLWWGGSILTKSPWILPWFCFWRWLQYFPAENTKFSGRENNCFLPRKFYARYENQLHSLREWSAFW